MSEIISSAEDAVLAIRSRLSLYLEKKLGVVGNKKPFKCPFHNDEGRPNMVLNPKTSYETAHCFSCGTTADIFNFANKIEGLPASGPDWIKETIPSLGKTLDLKIQLGDVSISSVHKNNFYKLNQDISDILSHSEDDYAASRGWKDTRLVMGSIDTDVLIEKLIELGWEKNSILSSNCVKWEKRNHEGQVVERRLFGKDKFTFAIQDSHKRTIGFIARWKEYDKTIHDEKFIHTQNNLIFDKSKFLFGIHADLKHARDEGIRIVEGPGDMAALHTKGIYNVVCALGVAINENQLIELKKLGIKKVIFNLDWDEAGQSGTERVLENVCPKVTDVNYVVVEEPKTKEKDVDEFLLAHTKEEYLALPEISIFEWKLKSLGENLESEEVCKIMMPMIATEQSAIRRSLLMKKLAAFTNIEYGAIEADIESMRNMELKQKRTSIEAAGQEFFAGLQKDPENAFSLISSLESELEKIERRYNKSALGVNYQLQRYQEIQTLRALSNEDHDASMFKFKYFKDFGRSFSGGMPITRSCLIYVGGRANSGKTLSCLALGSDVALHDNDAMVVIHSIDDSYELVEPRLKTNLYNMFYQGEFPLDLDMVVSPWKYKLNDVGHALKKANALFMDLLSEEKIVILDANDGQNLTSLERHWRYYRTRYPNRKFLGICDNTHDYQDFPELDQTTRMKMISTQQKKLVSKYSACMLATAEYRKAPQGSNTKMILPTNDDLADSRAMSYKPNIIMHVYNDVADRAEDAEIYYYDKYGKKAPRLLWLVTKNKMNSFKGRLVNDVDKEAVMLWPKSLDDAEAEYLGEKGIPVEAKQEMEEMDNTLGYELETDYKE